MQEHAAKLACDFTLHRRQLCETRVEFDSGFQLVHVS